MARGDALPPAQFAIVKYIDGVPVGYAGQSPYLADEVEFAKALLEHRVLGRGPRPKRPAHLGKRTIGIFYTGDDLELAHRIKYEIVLVT